MPDPVPPANGPDSADERSFLEAEREHAEAQRLQKEAEQLKAANSSLRAQVDELKALAVATGDGPKDLQRLHLLQIQPIRDVLVILLVLAVFWLGYILRPITVPMLLALTLAYLVEPVVRRVVAGRWMTRPQAAASVILIFLLVLTVPLALGTTLAVSQGLQYQTQVRENVEQIRILINDPDNKEAQERLKGRAGRGRAWLWIGKTIAGFANPKPTPEEEAREGEPAPGEDDEPRPDAGTPPPASDPLPARVQAAGGDGGAPSSVEPTPVVPPAPGGEAAGQPLAARAAEWASSALEDNLQAVGRVAARYLVGTGANAVEIGVKTVKTVVYLGFAAFLVLFFFFFFSTGYERVTTSIAEMIPKWKRQRTLSLLRQMDAVIAAFVRGRLIIMGILMVLFTMGFWLIGVPGPLIVGPITGVLAVVPYLGLISIPTAMLLMWLQPVGPAWQQSWWWILFAPVVLYFLIQTIEDYILTPQIQGKATDMDVPTILFAVLAGGILAGFYGVLLAIPAAACLKILLRESFWPRFRAWGEGRVKDFLPISRYDPTDAALSGEPPAPRE